MADFLETPQVYSFPIWNGQDVTFVVKRKDPVTSEYINFEDGTSAKIVFTSGVTEYSFDATVSGSQAEFFIDDTELLNIKTNSNWRLQFTVNGKDKTPVIGKVSRKDA